MTKSRKLIRCNPEKEDRLSNLPDETILRILSFMGARDAVRSGVWSKRFRYLWIHVSSLYFNRFQLQHIYSVLLFHKLPNLEKITVVKCHEGPGCKADFSKLIRVLSFHNVKEFTLKSQETDHKLPQHFYSNSSLLKLTLFTCKVETHFPVSWKSLQSLSFTEIDLTDITLDDVLSGCPSLELLKLCYCSKFTRIDMSNNKCLRKLVVDHYDQAGILEIIAPHLQSLVLADTMRCSKCKVSYAESITNCYLSFDIDDDVFIDENEEITMLTSLFEDLSDVEVVTIEEWILQRLSLMEQQGLPCPMSKTITSLKVCSTWTSDDIVGIVGILQNLYRLEKLVIEFWDCSCKSWFRKDENTVKRLRYWTAENIELKVKTVKINHLSEDGIVHSQNAILLLLEFLLKCAKFMENMTVIAFGSDEYFLKMSNKLLGLPRSSPHALVKMVRALV